MHLPAIQEYHPHVGAIQGCSRYFLAREFLPGHRILYGWSNIKPRAFNILIKTKISSSSSIKFSSREKFRRISEVSQKVYIQFDNKPYRKCSLTVVHKKITFENYWYFFKTLSGMILLYSTFAFKSTLTFRSSYVTAVPGVNIWKYVCPFLRQCEAYIVELLNESQRMGPTVLPGFCTRHRCSNG